jgi:hypothetical protein
MESFATSLLMRDGAQIMVTPANKKKTSANGIVEPEPFGA